MEKKINKDTPIEEIVKISPEATKILMESGMSCIGCPFAMSETLEQGAKAHNIDVKEILSKMKEKGIKVKC